MENKEKDWTGGSNSVFKTLGATSHAVGEREQNDFYATEPKAVECLLEKVQFAENIWECACGKGHISKVLEQNGHKVKSTDLIDRGFGEDGVDFLLGTFDRFDGDIITNPPYKFATEFVYRALDLVGDGNKVAMFLRVQFLEGKQRRKLFDKFPPKTILVPSSRLNCAKSADFDTHKTNGAVCYAWFVWEKGFKGKPQLEWIN